MSRVTPDIREFAERLVALESDRKSAAGASLPALRICAKMQPQLATLMGNAGFRALLSRALALASAQVSWLDELKIQPDGTMDGLGARAAQLSAKDKFEGSMELISQLLGLMAAFIGEDLTFRVMREIWPRLNLKSPRSGNGDKK